MEVLYKLPLILEPQPEGGYTVTCPTVPELITEGDTVKEALANASDALTAIIEAYADLGRPLPEAFRRSAPDEAIRLEATLVVGPSLEFVGIGISRLRQRLRVPRSRTTSGRSRRHAMVARCRHVNGHNDAIHEMLLYAKDSGFVPR